MESGGRDFWGTDPELVRSFRGHRDAVLSLDFHPSGRQVASAGADGLALLWNFKEDMRPIRLVGHTGAVNSIEFSPSGAWVVTGGADGTLRLWKNSAQQAKKQLAIKGHSAPVRAASFSADAQLLLSASDDKTLKLWTVSDRRFAGSLIGHRHWVRSARFSPDCRLIASGGEDKVVMVWDAETKRQVTSFEEHEGPVLAVAFHPDGTCVASGGEDRTVKLWDLRSRKLIQHYNAHGDSVRGIKFHPGGHFLGTVGDDGRVKLWDVRQGRAACSLSGHSGAVRAIAFSDTGEHLTTAGDDSLILVWKSNIAKPAEVAPSQPQYGDIPFRSNVRQQDPPPLSHWDDKENRGSGLAHPLAEDISRVVDRIVSQMDKMTSTFQGLDRRLTRVEETTKDLISRLNRNRGGKVRENAANVLGRHQQQDDEVPSMHPAFLESGPRFAEPTDSLNARYEEPISHNPADPHATFTSQALGQPNIFNSGALAGSLRP
eukprot:TRINITY_DN12939_c0_g1_i2.p1 TRINITY_DN12939_c0_g1~~TRINITY_DN12939_c0_g1_i2.p1  ORF type:complete len:487 (+),score=90.66 TRINITY_DN12939_c0_g1_i2:46-1506(+)